MTIHASLTRTYVHACRHYTSTNAELHIGHYQVLIANAGMPAAKPPPHPTCDHANIHSMYAKHTYIYIHTRTHTALRIPHDERSIFARRIQSIDNAREIHDIATLTEDITDELA